MNNKGNISFFYFVTVFLKNSPEDPIKSLKDLFRQFQPATLPSSLTSSWHYRACLGKWIPRRVIAFADVFAKAASMN